MLNVKCPVCQLELEGDFELTEEVKCPSCLATFVPSRIRPSCEGEFKPPRKNISSQPCRPSLKNCHHALHEMGLIVLAILAILGEFILFGINFLLVKAGTGLRTAPALSVFMFFSIVVWTWKSIVRKSKQTERLVDEPRPQSVSIGCFLTGLAFSAEWLVMFIAIIVNKQSIEFVESSNDVLLGLSIPWFLAKTMVALVLALILWRMSARSLYARSAFNACFMIPVPLALLTYLVLLKSGKIFVVLFLLKWILVGIALILVNSSEADKWFGKMKKV